jgi:hypothetical protein
LVAGVSQRRETTVGETHPHFIVWWCGSERRKEKGYLLVCVSFGVVVAVTIGPVHVHSLPPSPPHPRNPTFGIVWVVGGGCGGVCVCVGWKKWCCGGGNVTRTVFFPPISSKTPPRVCVSKVYLLLLWFCRFRIENLLPTSTEKAKYLANLLAPSQEERIQDLPP